MWECLREWLCSTFGIFGKSGTPSSSTTTLSTKIIYKLPDRYTKFYCIGTAFKDLDPSNWDAVAEGFRSRIIDWYFKPLSGFPTTWHEGYPVMCTMCAIIDLLTQYEFNKPWHVPKQFKHFLRTKMRIFNTKLSQPITVSKLEGGKWVSRPLEDYAEVFYTGIRCSLHHHGDLAPYAGICAQSQLVEETPKAGKSECGTYEYSLITVDPWKLRDEMEKIVHDYCNHLKSRPRCEKARFFRERFHEDFGIVIP